MPEKVLNMLKKDIPQGELVPLHMGDRVIALREYDDVVQKGWRGTFIAQDGDYLYFPIYCVAWDEHKGSKSMSAGDSKYYDKIYWVPVGFIGKLVPKKK